MLFGHEALRDREREIRRTAEDHRRVAAAHDRARPVDVDAEIRALIRREEGRAAYCSDELARKAG